MSAKEMVHSKFYETKLLSPRSLNHLFIGNRDRPVVIAAIA